MFCLYSGQWTNNFTCLLVGTIRMIQGYLRPSGIPGSWMIYMQVISPYSKLSWQCKDLYLPNKGCIQTSTNGGWRFILAGTLPRSSKCNMLMLRRDEVWLASSHVILAFTRSAFVRVLSNIWDHVRTPLVDWASLTERGEVRKVSWEPWDSNNPIPRKSCGRLSFQTNRGSTWGNSN